MKFLRLQPRDDRGAAAVEFALVLIPLLLIVGGIVDFGYVFAQKIALNQSVREGARELVVQPDDSPITPTNAVRTAATDSFIDDPTTITVTNNTCPSVGYGKPLTVTASYVSNPPLGIVHALTAGHILGPTTLTASATFRCEW